MTELAIQNDLTPSEYKPIDKNVSGFAFNSRGFAIYAFKTVHGVQCELKESFKKDAVILVDGNHCLALGKRDIEKLLPFLNNFVASNNGSIVGDDFASEERHAAVQMASLACNLDFGNNEDDNESETIELD